MSKLQSSLKKHKLTNTNNHASDIIISDNEMYKILDKLELLVEKVKRDNHILIKAYKLYHINEIEKKEDDDDNINHESKVYEYHTIYMSKCRYGAILMIYEETKNNIKYVERKIKEVIHQGYYSIISNQQEKLDPNKDEDVKIIVMNLERLCFEVNEESTEWIKECNMITTYPFEESKINDNGLYLSTETLYLKKIEYTSEFWELMDELVDDKSSLYYNRDAFLRAFIDGDLYGLKMHETDEMYTCRMSGESVRDDCIFCQDYKKHESNYLVVCLCVCNKKQHGTLEYIWTHSRVRKRGLATILVNYLQPDIISKPLDEALGFWNKLGYKYDTTENFMIRK